MTTPSDPPTPYIARKGIPYGPEYQQQIAAFVGVPRREWKLVHQNIYLTPRWQHFKLADGRAVRITHGMQADTVEIFESYAALRDHQCRCDRMLPDPETMRR
jgi:hypothetical protein